MFLGRLEYIQLNLLYPNLVSLIFRWLLESCKDINNQLLIKFQQNRFKPEEGRVSSDSRELINSMLNKDELTQKW